MRTIDFIKKPEKKVNTIISLLMTLVLAAGLVVTGPFDIEAKAAKGRTLTLEAAKRAAVATSYDLDSLSLKLSSKQAALSAAYKSVALKKKNLSTFRWSPLLSFKFPQKPNLNQAFEFEFKPLAAQMEIQKVKLQTADKIIEIQRDVNVLYVDIVTLENKVATGKSRIANMKTAIDKAAADILLNRATKADKEKMEKTLEQLEKKLIKDSSQLSQKKQALSKMVGFDVTSGYAFETPYVESELSRSMLKGLIDYTLDRDLSYATAGIDAQLGRFTLETNYRLMSGHYSSAEMSLISSYVIAALAGQDFNGNNFYRSYQNFLNVIEDPWRGKFGILFIRFPREWIKGSLSGARYVEEDPYALYQAALDYKSLLKDYSNTKENITKQVTDAFNNYIGFRNTYRTNVENLQAQEEVVENARLQNSYNNMSYSEYKAELDTYESMQDEVFDSLSEYTKGLYELDRLTCGGVSALLTGTDVEMGVIGGGQSTVEANYSKEARYFVEPIISSSEFRLGLFIPDDFEVNVTSFELIVDGVRVGNRTNVDERLRHLTLTSSNAETAIVRLYDRNAFAGECEIDTSQREGTLKIISDYSVNTDENLAVGKYISERSDLSGVVSIYFRPNKEENIAGFKVFTPDGLKQIGEPGIIPVDKPLKGLHLMESDLPGLIIEYYDSNGAMLYKGYFSPKNCYICRNPE